MVVHPVGRPDLEVLSDLPKRRRKAPLDDRSANEIEDFLLSLRQSVRHGHLSVLNEYTVLNTRFPCQFFWCEIYSVGVWLAVIASLATMTAAMERGDVDEAARQGALAGPATVERALGSGTRASVLAGIAAAPAVADRAELLPALARVAASGDRRTAIPAAHAARAIARELAEHARPDDLAPDDLDDWRAPWLALAMRGDRLVEVRVAALDTAAALAHDTTAVAFDLPAALADRDPAFRVAAAELVPDPAPAAAVAPLAAAVANDTDVRVALAAAQALCAGLGDPSPALAALGASGMARLRAVAAAPTAPLAAARDAARCLAADTSAESAAALAAIHKRTR